MIVGITRGLIESREVTDGWMKVRARARKLFVCLRDGGL